MTSPSSCNGLYLYFLVFGRARLPCLHDIVERRARIRQFVQEIFSSSRKGRVPHFSRSLREVGPFFASAPGDPRFAIFACTIPTEGAPSLRFLQGWAEMLRVPFDFDVDTWSNPLGKGLGRPPEDMIIVAKHEAS